MRHNIVIKMNLLVYHIPKKFCINNDAKTAKNSSRSTSAPPMNKISQHRLTSKTITVKSQCLRKMYIEKLNSEYLPCF